MAWKRDQNLIAERFRKDELPGFLSKQFEAKGDEFVVLERNGEIYLEKDHGTLSISSFMGSFTDILMIDKSEKTIEHEVKSIFLSDGTNIGIKLALKFRVFNSDHFSKNLLGQRKRLFLADVWDETVSDVLCRRLLSKLQKKPTRDFSSGGFREKTRLGIEADVKKKFKDWGLLLTSLSLIFDMPGASDAEPAKPEAVPARPNAGNRHTQSTLEFRKPGATIEDEAEDLEKERLEKEVTIAFEKKQMQEDVEDAMEAMELKDIQEKKRVLNAGDSRDDERKSLVKELENLRRAKELTERKFYKKELSEDSFQRMMEEFEGRIIEIETKLKSK
jgi:hypothetical protein